MTTHVRKLVKQTVDKLSENEVKELSVRENYEIVF